MDTRQKVIIKAHLSLYSSGLISLTITCQLSIHEIDHNDQSGFFWHGFSDTKSGLKLSD